ncbi:hypothetical protein BDQ17DRAFT_207865 [Cyathus striatus]|nr:hypothetical protein BDQ17DRAFT_207865 [Cyathus striatus]
MEGLTTGQMVSYMRGLGGHVLRGYKQVLSAAFNLDQPILDDSPEGEEGKQHPKVLVDKMEIARRAIELTVLGGFDKIIWGADGYNSSIHELGFRNSLELVHRAHEFGLTTYMSAGLKVHNIKDAVLSGLDGVGVGAGVIRAIDQRTGMQGPYRESQIDKLTVARDNAANSVRGRGVHLLARLDQMFFLGTLTHDEYILRNQLYTALYSKNESEVQRILCDDPAALRVASISDDGELPWVGKAKRILRSEYPLLRSGVGKVKDGEVLWDEFCRCLEVLVSEEDDEGIYAYYDSESWRAFRKAYREVMGQSELGQGDNRITLKIGPYSV